MARLVITCCLLAAIVFGVAFVYWPRLDISYVNSPNGNLCPGVNSYQYLDNPTGVKKSGLPFIDRTAYNGNCINTSYDLSKGSAAADFLTGFLLVCVGAIGVNKIFRKGEKAIGSK
jgi:hypothetical protein